MLPSTPSVPAPPTRLIADRRGGVDRRAEPRRRVVMVVGAERRAVVDRRTGAERRSTVERRGRSRRSLSETPAEHVRNALQLLTDIAEAGLPVPSPEDLRAAVERLRRALELLESR